MKIKIPTPLTYALTLLLLLCFVHSSYAGIDDNPVVLDSIVKVQPTCGLDNGLIEIFASGSSHIFYSIDNGQTFQEDSIFVNLGVGDYSIQITDGLACVINTTIQLTNGPQVEISNVNVTCHEQSVSGDINVDVQYGIQPFSYSWLGPNGFSSTAEDLFGVPPGSYDVTITDNVGCHVIETIEIPICCGLAQGLQLTCPQDLFLECGNPDNDEILEDWFKSAKAFDGTGTPIDVYNDFDSPQNAFCEDIVVVEFSTTDQCGNSTTCSAKILIADINIPTIICPENITLDFAPSENINNIEDWLETAMASDNCSGAYVENDFIVEDLFIDCENGSTTLVNFTALDQCQNTESCSAYVTINPAEQLIFDCSNTLSLDCDEANPNLIIQDWLNEVKATDANGVQTYVENNFEFKTEYFCGDTYPVQFTTIDHCGKVLHCASLIEIVDNVSPEINCEDHLNISAYANDKTEQIEEWLESIQAIDNCGNTEIENNFIFSSLNYACGESDSQVVKFEAIDECGNSQVCLLSINLIASELEFQIPPAIQLECETNFNQEIESWLNQAKAIDQFGYEVPLENNFDISSLSCSSQLEVSFKYENPCGELFESSSSIGLQDNIGPEIICPPSISIQSFELPNYDFDQWIEEFKAEDLCSEVFMYHDFDYNNFEGSCKENQEVKFVAEDDCGNISECIIDIKISDFAPPEIICPDDISLETSNQFAKEDLDAHLSKIISNTNSTLSFEYSEEIDFEKLNLVYQSRVVNVKVTATNECDESVSCNFNIHISAEAEIFAPSIFSPNDDGDNDRFTIYGNNHLNTVIKLSIYDRLGNRMQHLTNIPINHPSLGWDGTFQGRDCAMGVYAYHALILDFAGNEIEFVGSITLVR